MHIVFLNKELEEAYEKFLLEQSNTLFFFTNKYRRLLKEFLKVEDYYFLAIDNESKIIGVLPSFLKRNDTYGHVLNSLPFYGSHGGIIEFSGKETVKQELLKAFYAFAQTNQCISTTLITSPFETNLDFYHSKSEFTFVDQRIGQLTRLPKNSRSAYEDLFKILHYKTRNMVRKAQNTGLCITTENNESYYKFLIDTHLLNISEIGGIPKPEHFFKLIPKIFEYGTDYKLYTALLGKQTIAALLVFYFNKTVEYFTPVVLKEFRHFQPLSLLIFEVMKDGIKQGYEWWNWGGTWLTQDGVYRFKKRWGTEDKAYFYFTRLFNERILTLSRDQLLKEYPFFYVIPFGRLKQ